MRATVKNESDIISLLITGYPSTITIEVCEYVHKYGGKESQTYSNFENMSRWAYSGWFVKPSLAEDFKTTCTI